MDQKPSELTDTPKIKLPRAVARIAEAHPELWKTYQRLGELVGEVGPLGERERRLVHLAYALGAASEGAAHSHARRALAEGISPTEIEHVALLAITTLGWPQATRGLTIVRDVTDPNDRGSK